MVAVHGGSCAEVVVLEKAVVVVVLVQAVVLDLEVVVQAAVLEVVLHPHAARGVEVVVHEVVEVVEVVLQ